tara:strand:- start:102 stop:470 length:369 start_codon:yes stop_codon:yes gene_type:complete
MQCLQEGDQFLHFGVKGQDGAEEDGVLSIGACATVRFANDHICAMVIAQFLHEQPDVLRVLRMAPDECRPAGLAPYDIEGLERDMRSATPGVVGNYGPGRDMPDKIRDAMEALIIALEEDNE